MPLFFFISGYFAYSATYDWDLFKRRSVNRIVKQFYPTFIIWVFFCLIFQEGDFKDWLLDPFKGGYWFTFVSVEMFFTVIPFLWLLSIKKTSSKLSSICLLLLCVVIEAVYFGFKDRIIQNEFFNQMSLWQYSRYMPFFIMGMIAKIQREQFNSLCSNGACVLFALIVFILSVIYPQYSLLGLISAISGIIIIYSIFYYFENLKRPIVFKVFNLLSIIGTSTLEIYLLHYFFIYSFREVLNLDYLASISGTIMEFPIYFVVSVVICAICLFTVRIFKKLHIYGMLFPAVSSKKVGMAINNH